VWNPSPYIWIFSESLEDVNLAKKAGGDLEQVISLTFDLEQNAQKLQTHTN